MATTTLEINSPALQEATKNSTTIWQQNLESLFRHAKDRFPDVVWELGVDEESGRVTEEVWGHKAIVYARAPPSFQTRYFSFRPNVTTPYSSSPTGTLPMTSVLSLDIPPIMSRTPSPFRSSSPAPTTAGTGTLLRLSTSISPALFSNELEYLYTGQGFGEAFEFLFDSPESTHDELDAEELRIDKLRKDLVFMWRSRLYSDVRIALTGNFSSSNHESTTAIFSSHRFILASRSPYFHTALIGWPQKSAVAGEPLTLTLPSPPFTPASLHFTLGFIYTGTLIFSHRSYDLDTAFHILRSATYLSLQTLHDEIQARIVQEMMHGLFHAFLPFAEYERLTSGAWGTGGCRCRQCARRAPRVLEFSLKDDVKNTLLERGARRALVGLFGEGWCTPDFAALPIKIRESLLKGVGKRTTPANALALLFAAEHALAKLAAVIDAWSGEVQDMVLTARKGIDDVICAKSEACFGERDWEEIMERDGIDFNDAERVEWIMAAVCRGVNDKNAALVYQTLVSSILLRPHPTETNSPMLSSTSHIRVQVEEARMDVVRWIGKRWVNIRQEGGFDDLEGWAVKEISDNIEVPVEDLLTPAPPSHGKPQRPNTLLRPKDVDSNNDSISMHSSMRVSVLSRNLPVGSTTRRVTPTPSIAASSSAASFKSLARSNGTRSPVMRGGARKRVDGTRTNGRGQEAEEEGSDADKQSLRPDSKLTPGLASIDLPPYSTFPGLSDRSASPTPQPSIIESRHGEEDDEDNGTDYQESIRESVRDSVRDSGLDQDYDTPPGSPSQLRSPSLANSETRLSRDLGIGTPPLKKTLIRKISPAPVPRSSTSRTPLGHTRPTSSASSIRSSSASIRSSTASVRSHASTIRKSSAGSTAPSGSLRPSVSMSSQMSRTTSRASSTSTTSSRPTSSVSTTTDGATTFKTANSNFGASASGATRPRRSSTASTISNVSVRGNTSGGGRATPTRSGAVPIRQRKTSAGSAKSGTSATPTRRPPVPPLDPNKLSPATAKRSISSSSSVRSVSSTISTATSAAQRKNTVAVISKRPVTAPEQAKEQDKKVLVESPQSVTRPVSSHSTINENDPAPTSSNITIKGKNKDITLDHKKSESTASSASNSTLKRRGSTDTITTKTSLSAISNTSTPRKHAVDTTPQPKKKPTTLPVAKENQRLPSLPFQPRGATLEIGIPCIISSKRKRFKAYARYIGEVEGELGSWVGIEVPVGDSWGTDRDADGDRQWNDGSWGGIRYFEIGNSVESEWEYGGGDDRAARRRRLDGSGSGSAGTTGGKGLLKREGDQLNVERAKRLRSVSPAISDASGIESRGLFVRPQQVLYVVDAVGSDF
ncbi:hypothetical protein BDZ94DRAFT_1327146 [Collybia nuda]|uniref:CAP-Gly domain-containing protein n=1 Tax=Collybia nuda TaxID=64659 RepID=A0A9P5XTC1_9AGAR|nr:hypothetical protein BDZ94DRAFT_1327146 [Collybia nuda]